MNGNQRVLLVEDDADLREALADVLSDEGYAVGHAAHGVEALEMLRGDLKYCVVLLDVRMPVMDGIEFRRRQLADPAISEIPVVALSGDSGEREQLAALGVTVALSKPVDVLQLLEAVADRCGRGDALVQPATRKLASG